MLQLVQILIADLLVAYFFLYLIVETQKKREARMKALAVDGELHDEWNELKEKTGASNNDMLSYALDLMKKDLAKRSLAAQESKGSKYPTVD